MEKSPDSNYESTIAENIKWSKVRSYSYELEHPELFNIIEQRRISIEMDKLAKEIGRSLPVLDVGSGTGNLAKFLTRRGIKVVAIDLSLAMLKENNTSHKVICDACYLPFRDGSFGGIVEYSVLSLLPEPTQALKEMCRVAAMSSVLFLDGLPPYVVEWKDRKYPLIHASVERLAWLLWLILHPKYLGRAFKVYSEKLFSPRLRTHRIQERNDIDYKKLLPHKIDSQGFHRALEECGFTVQMVSYGRGATLRSFLKARRNN